MLNKSLPFLFAFISLTTSCKKDPTENNPDNRADTSEPTNNKSSWWKPKAGASFDWELDDLNSNADFSAEIVDVDAFTTSAETVSVLHAKGKKVIAYLSVGTIEDDRPDISLLPKEVIGQKYPEWPNEKWLDIREIDKLKPWLNARLNMILKKGFDAIEPDNLDCYTNETGFNLSVDDAKKYMEYLITMAHANGLGIGQKNVPDVSADYAGKFDWVLTEDAFQQGWQDALKTYIKLNKPVFSVEYTDKMTQNIFENQVCPLAIQMGYTAILKRRNLDKWVDKCR